MNELAKLTKQFLQEEYASGDCVLADIETCNYFRDHFKKQIATPQQIKPAVKPVMQPPPIVKTTPPPIAKIEKELPIKHVQSVDHSEFKKLLNDHFPGVSIIDPPSQ
jgi:hypothetical protein